MKLHCIPSRSASLLSRFPRPSCMLRTQVPVVFTAGFAIDRSFSYPIPPACPGCFSTSLWTFRFSRYQAAHLHQRHHHSSHLSSSSLGKSPPTHGDNPSAEDAKSRRQLTITFTAHFTNLHAPTTPWPTWRRAWSLLHVMIMLSFIPQQSNPGL